MIPTVKITGSWDTVVEGAARTELEHEVLPRYLPGQRWFGGKGRRIAAVRFIDCGRLPAAESLVFALLLEVRFTDGKSDLYFAPLGVSTGETAVRMRQSMQPWLIARLQGGQGEALLHDALADDDTCMSLLNAIGQKREFATRNGRIRAFPTAAFASLAGNNPAGLGVERGPATSSNSLLIYGRRLLLKLFRRLEAGVNPEYEIGRFLTEGGIFQRIPRVAGAIEYHRSGSEPITLAILQTFVANEGDGWKHALDELSRYYQRTDNRVPADVPDGIGAYVDAAGLLGRRTAELHCALAADARQPAFAPEPSEDADGARLQHSIRNQAEMALAALRANLQQLPEEIASSAQQLLEQAPEKLEQLQRSKPVSARPDKIRCHGDYHLAQVLRVDNDYVLIDFEGEPTRTVAERRVKHSPLKDVAGMLRSYHYAAYAGLFAFTRARPHDFGRLQPWAELWHQGVSAAFIRAYRAGVQGQTFVPADPEAFAELLDGFRLDKMFYELNYELNNRPDWVGIPLRSILVQLQSEPRP